MRPRLLYEDARRVARGVRDLVSYLTSKEHVDLGFGYFSAESPVVVRGTRHRYVARLVSARPSAAAVTLRIEVFSGPVPIDGQNQYAEFARRLLVQGRGTLAITVEYDWLDQATFILGRTHLPPDNFYRRSPDHDPSNMFAVRALLLNGHGRPLDMLTIYQAMRE